MYYVSKIDIVINNIFQYKKLSYIIIIIKIIIIIIITTIIIIKDKISHKS